MMNFRGDDPGPEAQSRHKPGCREPTLVQVLDLFAGARQAVSEVAHHLRVGVELDLMLKMLVGERNQRYSGGVERGL